jgi:CBS domain containing-hemolysin-like protein
LSLYLIILSVLLIAMAAVLAAAESAVLLLSPGRVHRLLESRARGSEALDVLVERRHRLRAVSALAAALAAASAAITGAVGLRGATTATSLVAALLGIVVAYSIGEALPRTFAVANPERLALDAAPVALPLVTALWPLASLLGAPWRWAAELAAREKTLTPWAVTPEGRGASGDEESEREVAEEQLLEAVSDFSEKVAREVMVPRTDVAALPVTATAADAIAIIESSGYSRLPIFGESIDDVRGVLYAKDLLVAMGKDGVPPSLTKIARKAHFVPETKPVDELLREMRTRTHIAIVADEYGGTSGIVTLEDLLEEIVGDIADEYDQEEPLVVELGEGRYQVDARLPVDEANDLLGTDLETEADSIGGFITEVAGRIPEPGESLVIEGLCFTVTERQGTRIVQLTIEPDERGPEGDHDA